MKRKLREIGSYDINNFEEAGVMKRLLVALLAAALISTPIEMVFADRLDQTAVETDRLWRRGRGAEDGAFTSVATSMIAWGVGIGAVAALLAILIESSTTSAHAHCH